MWKMWLFLVGKLLLLLAVLCNGDTASKKVSVSEVTFDSAVEDIQWASPDFTVVLAITVGGRLFRSADNGKTWNEITSSLNDVAKKNSETLAQSLIVSTIDRNIVLVVGSHHNQFISENAGRTFRRLDYGARVHNWVFHPTSPKKALFSIWSEACTRVGGAGANDMDCNHMLYYTSDLGISRLLVSTYVVQFNWGDVKINQEDRVYFSHHKSKTGSQNRMVGWTKEIDFAYTEAPRSSKETAHPPTHHLLVRHGNKFLISNGYIFVAQLHDQELQTVNLLVSTDGGLKFEEAKLPTQLHQKSFTILDTSESAVIIQVNHGDVKSSNTGNVYVSDHAGLRFSLSLPNNVRTSSGETEFDRVTSLLGVYLANFIDESHPVQHLDKAGRLSEDSMSDSDEEESQEDDELDAIQTAIDRRRKKRGKIEEPIRTVVSFDKGGVWSYLKPPKVDSRGNPIECPNPARCWLHLHGISNYHSFAPFYSVDNAVGIVMGTGSVGSQLRFEEDEVNTYLSRNGGLTWIEAHKGAYIYEFGDHGGLLVMADDTKSTNQVVFSWNEGQSWYDFDLGVNSLEVDNIVIEPNSSSVEFLLYGTRGDAGVLFHLDFGALQQPACKGVWAADSVASDYETWSPSDGHSTTENCLLGKQVSYTRRKQTSECFNGKDFERPLFKKNCSCAPDDYDCDFGFTRHIESLVCVPDLESPDLLTQECRSGKSYQAHAYRKVPGDTCEGGWQPELVTVPCPAHSPLSAGAKTVLLVMILIILLLGFAALLSKYPQLANSFFNVGFDSFQSVRYSSIGGSNRGARTAGRMGNDMEDDELNDFAGGAVSSAVPVDRGARPVQRGKRSSNTAAARQDGRKSRYEPELDFIQAAQEDHEDSAPTLMSYNYSYRDQLSSSDDNDDLLRDADPPSPPRRVTGGDSVPRLAPPPSGGAF